MVRTRTSYRLLCPEPAAPPPPFPFFFLMKKFRSIPNSFYLYPTLTKHHNHFIKALIDLSADRPTPFRGKDGAQRQRDGQRGSGPWDLERKRFAPEIHKKKTLRRGWVTFADAAKQKPEKVQEEGRKGDWRSERLGGGQEEDDARVTLRV